VVRLLGIVHCYLEYASLKGEPGSDVSLQDLGFQTDFAVYLQIKQTWLAFSKHTHAHVQMHTVRAYH